jgi:hypothetical protein
MHSAAAGDHDHHDSTDHHNGAPASAGVYNDNVN